jgi:hypothetical protein
METNMEASLMTMEERTEVAQGIDPLMYSVLKASMRTQTDKIPGKGSPVCLVGAPGIGKTHAFRQFAWAENLFLMTVILGRIPSVDIGGVYVPDIEKGELTHLITRRFLGEHVPAGYDGIFILFDEIGTSMPDQQASIQSMVEDWSLEGNDIQSPVYFGFATNRVEDNCGANELIKSLVDRLYIYDYEVDHKSWIKWAINDGINESIVAYIAWQPEALHMFDPKAKMGGQPDPRSWAKLSYLMEGETDPLLISHMAQAKVGSAQGLEFSGFRKMYKELSTVDAVMANPDTAQIPHHNVSAMYAMVTNIASMFAKKKRDDVDLTEEEVSAAITYIRRMDETMAVFGFRMFHEANPMFRERSDEYAKFLVDHKDLTI